MSGYHADGADLCAASRELTAAADALHSASALLDQGIGESFGSGRLTAAVAELARSTAGDLAAHRNSLADSAQRVADALAGYQDADLQARDHLRSPESGLG